LASFIGGTGNAERKGQVVYGRFEGILAIQSYMDFVFEYCKIEYCKIGDFEVLKPPMIYQTGP
jgi:hypothetical protein